MPSPAVSHRTWERTRALAQLDMGTMDIDAGELSFEKKVEMLCRTDWREKVEDVEDGDYYHSEWGEDGVRVGYDANGRDRPHRPEVSQATLRELRETVEEQYPNVPAESLGYEKQLKLVLDRAETYFSELDCHIVPRHND